MNLKFNIRNHKNKTHTIKYNGVLNNVDETTKKHLMEWVNLLSKKDRPKPIISHGIDLTKYGRFGYDILGLLNLYDDKELLHQIGENNFIEQIDLILKSFDIEFIDRMKIIKHISNSIVEFLL